MNYVRDYHAPLILPLINLLVVLTVGISLALLTLNNRDLLKRTVDNQTRQACNTAGFKVYPTALSDPAELQKLLAFNEKCHALNHVTDKTEIRLPQTPPQGTPDAPKA